MPTPTLLGDLSLQDDYTHPLGAGVELQREHVLQLLRPRAQERRLRPARQSRERGLRRDDDRSLPARWQRAVPVQAARRSHNNDAMDAGGMRFEVIEPMQKLRTTYDGSAVHLTDADADGRPARGVPQQSAPQGPPRPHARSRGPGLRQQRQPATGRRSREGVREGALRAAHARARHDRIEGTTARRRRRSRSMASVCATTRGGRATGRRSTPTAG